MKSLLCKYRWVIILIFLLPIIANFIVLFPAFSPIAGESKDWLNFFAVYFSGIITAFVSFWILYTTIQSNTKENQKNRDIQTNVIKYQTKIAWINQLRSAIVYAQENLSSALQNKYIKLKEKNEDSFNQLTSELFENANSVKRQFVNILYGCGIYEDDFITFVDSFCKRYICYLLDLEFLFSIDYSITQEQLKNRVDDYKKISHSLLRSNRRIWFIIEEHAYGTKCQDFSYYVNEISKRYEFQDFEKRCLELLKYELENAKKILNGTEQDK